jgi:hypothetical protein
MADDMSDCPDTTATPEPSPPRQGGRGARPMDKLPTLQRNALCKIFDRPEFQPEEVAALGYRRLQQAEGIGLKGLNEITAWLNAFGYALAPPEPESGPRQAVHKKAKKNIELAVRLLRTHGYLVQPGNDPSSTGKA